MLLGNYWRWKPDSRVHPGGQTNKMAQKQAWSLSSGRSTLLHLSRQHSSQKRLRVILSAALLLYQEVRVANFIVENQRQQVVCSAADRRQDGFPKGHDGKE